MLKRIVLSLFTAALLTTIVPAFAQETTQPPPSGAAWTVSLYDQRTGTVTRLAPMGETISQFSLPLPEGSDSYSYAISTSPLGNTIAYIVSQLGDSSSRILPTRLVVYDTATEMIEASADLKPGTTQESINAAGDALHFSADGTRVLTAYYVQVGDTNQYTMEAAALDVTTGKTINALSGDPFSSVGAQTDAAYRVHTLNFRDDVATFRLEPVFFAQNLLPLVINWNMTSNTVEAANPALVNAVDYAPLTDNALLLTFDAASAAATPETNVMGETGTIWNTVQLFNAASGDSPKTIYTADALNGAQFVQNGDRIIVLSDFANGTLINLNGSVAQTFPNVFKGSNSLLGTPEGFVSYDPQTMQEIVLTKTSDDSFAQTTVSTASVPFTSISVQDYGVIAPAAG